MMNTTKNGWHVVGVADVYTENGKVIRGKSDYENTTLYPYRYSKRLRAWVNVSGEISLSAFRSGIARGTIDLK